uniref:Uncharacterized protein n=1 Tax=Nonomuraea gerenzanensis TaxID=93944 RepID=A0A1M4ED73_9ACTN|nr:hypothetical protein BN4615_P6134 [Nonomuraea gerenzanensis]
MAEDGRPTVDRGDPHAEIAWQHLYAGPMARPAGCRYRVVLSSVMAPAPMM